MMKENIKKFSNYIKISTFKKKTELDIFFYKKLEKEEEEMAHNVVIEDHIFATNKATPTDVSPINIGLKVPPLRSVSTNLAENKEPVYEEITDDYASKNYDTTSKNKYDYLDFVHYNGTTNKIEQIKSSFF